MSRAFLLVLLLAGFALSSGLSVDLAFEMLFEREALPESLRSVPLKSGTPFLLHVIRNERFLSQERRRVLRQKLARPSLPNSYDTPDGHFKIHYNASVTDTYYVRRCGEFFERAWYVEVESLGFSPPVCDGGLGGDDRFDVYIVNLGAGVYGITYPDGSTTEPTSAYINVNTSYDGFPPNDDPEGSSWGAFKVTCAHEFFHAIQFAYDPGEEVWMLEVASVWMEDVVFDYVNDYYNYLRYFFGAPYSSLMEYSMHMYGSCVWFHYLSQRFGAGIVNRIFDEMVHLDGLSAISAALDSLGADLAQEFLTFACWNYLTGPRADSFHYDEAESYDTVSLEARAHSLPYTFSPVSSHRPHSFAANYILLPTTPEAGVTIDFSGSGDATWGVAVVVPGDSAEILLPDGSGFVPTGGRPAALVIAAAGAYSEYPTYDYSVSIYPCSGVAQSSGERPGRLSVFPNPFCGALFVLPGGHGEVSVFDLGGRRVFSARTEGKPVLWKPRRLPPGVYVVEAGGERAKVVYCP